MLHCLSHRATLPHPEVRIPFYLRGTTQCDAARHDKAIRRIVNPAERGKTHFPRRMCSECVVCLSVTTFSATTIKTAFSS